MKNKYIDIVFPKKRKYSGFYILPTLILNTSYKTLTFILFVFVIEFQYNDYNSKCENCGKLCRNKKDANNHCLENSRTHFSY